MALTTNPITTAVKDRMTDFGDSPDMKSVLTDVGTIVDETQALDTAFAAGTTAATNIAVAGALTTATIIKAFNITDGVDLTSEASFPTAGNLQFSTTNTTGKIVMVLFWNHA